MLQNNLDAIESLRDLATTSRLGPQLERATRGRSQPDVCAAIFTPADKAIVRVHGAQLSTFSDGSERVTVGCLSKALTSALVLQAVADCLFSLDVPVIDLVTGIRHGSDDVFRGVTLGQLLNHTHGLDLNALQRVPLKANGRIDIDVLCSIAARTPRLSEPGELYSYGDTGPWLAAAILEKQLGVSYESLLETFLGRLGILPRRDPQFGGPYCPSRGNSLNLSVRELVELIQWFASCGPPPGDPVPLPGWALERGSALGWKYYGDGWFGQNALLPSNTSSVVRFHTQQRMGVVLSTSSRSAALVLARLTQGLLPEFRDIQIPRPLEPKVAIEALQRAPLGLYANGGVQARVLHGTEGVPVITLQRMDQSGSPEGPPVSSSMRPCTLDTFMLDSSLAMFGTWIQFVRGPASGAGYLWNGKILLRRRDE